MKRKLTTEEEKLERLGLERNKRILEKLKTQLQYNLDVLDLAKRKEELDDKYRAHLREATADDNRKAIESIKQDISIKETAIKIALGHLNTGVDVKENKISG